MSFFKPVIFFLCCLALENLYAAECKHPFSFSDNSYNYTEKLSCDSKQNIYSLNLKLPPQLSTEIQLIPSCLKANVAAFNLIDGKTSQAGKEYPYIAYFSNDLKNMDFSKIVISSACDGSVVGTLENFPKVVNVSGEILETSYRFYLNKNLKSLYAYVPSTSNLASQVKVFDLNSNIIAEAKKQTYNTKDCGQSDWLIQDDNNVNTRIFLSYLLALKDNEGFMCSESSSGKGKVSNSGVGAAIGISVAALVGVGLLSYLGYRVYKKWLPVLNKAKGGYTDLSNTGL